jgi:hypothetical protein
MMIGQIAVMKMTKIAEGWLSRNSARERGNHAREAPSAALETQNQAHHKPGVWYQSQSPIKRHNSR